VRPTGRANLSPGGLRFVAAQVTNMPSMKLPLATMVLPVVFCVWPDFAPAQKSAATPAAPASIEEAKPDYSGESSVVQEMTTRFTFSNDGTFVRDQTTRVFVQSDAGVKEWGVLAFPFEGETQTVELSYIRVHRPDGTTVETSGEDARDIDSEITREAPLYSDLREKQVPVRGLNPGDTLEYAVRWHTSKALAPGQFWTEYNFTRSGIVLSETVEVSVPADRAVRIHGPAATQKVSVDAGRRTYTWTNSNSKAEAKIKTGQAAIDTALGRDPSPDIEVSSFQSWDDVGGWYWSLEQDRVAPSPEIRSKAADLTKGATDDLAKVKAIYAFVSTHYRYIGVDFGLGRYKPHAAADVLGNNFGDCKDKQTLLASLLAAAGVTIYPALINTSHNLDADMPSPAQFDHVIGYFPQGSGGMWLDTTPELTQQGFLMQRLRDKQALVIFSGKSARLIKTPIDPPEPFASLFKVDGKLADDGTLTAKIENIERDDYEAAMRTVFRQLSPSQWQEFVQQLSYRLGFEGTVSDVKTDPPESVDTPYRTSWDYLRKEYPDWDNHRFLVPGARIPFAADALNPNSTDPVYLGSPGKSEWDARIEVPPGYRPVAPQPVDIVHDYAEYHANYSVDGNALLSQQFLLVKMHEVPTAELAEFKKFVSALGDNINLYVQTRATGSQSSLPNSPERMAELMQSGMDELPASPSAEANRFETAALSVAPTDRAAAAESLKNAVAADPKFTRAWLRLAAMQSVTRQYDDAVGSYRSAMAINPKQAFPYKALAYSLVGMNRRAEAIQVWSELLSAVPDDPDAPASLGSLLVAQKRYQEAIPPLEKAIKLYPDDRASTGNLAQAYMMSGNLDEGRSLLSKELEKGPFPLALNNVAYALADANVDLTDALGYAQKAVKQQEDATKKIDSTALKIADARQMPELASFWDTLGWVHFRLGHLELAESYLTAAWQLSQFATIGDHLAQLDEQLHKQKAAVHLYEQALATMERKLPVERRDAIREHVKAIDPAADLSTAPRLSHASPTDELTDARRVKVGRIFPGYASAEFFILLAPGNKVEAITYVDGSEELEKVETSLADSDFHTAFPETSDARILRRAVLTCSEISGCELVLYPLDSVRSVN
jgi:tetratricopeptide (TPR) repeat protein